MECQLTQSMGFSKTGLWILLIFAMYGLLELSNRLVSLAKKEKTRRKQNTQPRVVRG